MNLMATTNHSDNKIILVVFSSSCGSAFKHAVNPQNNLLESGT